MKNKVHPFANLFQQLPKSNSTFPLEKLHQIGKVDVFNIEAGKPAKAINKSALWFNLAFIMDRSLIDGNTLAELNKNSEIAGYSLKEMAINTYNEMDVNLATLLTVKYCVEQGHKITGKPFEQPLNFVIHVHRSSSAITINKLIARLLTECVPEQYEFFYKETQDKIGKIVREIDCIKAPRLNVVIHFRRGYAEELIDPIYKQADILFSYSMVGGLSPKLKSGSITLPHKFVPFDDKKYLLYPDLSYTATNHMFNHLDAILAQPQETYFETLKNKFASENKSKLDKPRMLTQADFHPVTVLQVNDLFHPLKAKDSEQSIYVTVVTKNKKIQDNYIMHQNINFRLKNNICAGTLGISNVEDIVEAIRAGYRRFDLATAYKTNKLLGDAIVQEHVKREEFDICTKINDVDLINHKFSVHSILKEILCDLNTNYIDTLMLHSPALLLHDKATEIFDELIKLKKSGLIKHIGVSNFTTNDLKRLDNKYLKHITYNSIEISPYCQQKDTVTFCQKNNITIMPYRPFGKGKADDLLQNLTLKEIAKKYNVTIFQVILAWTMQQNMIVIVKTSKEHLTENLKACDLVLNEEDMEAISKLDRNLHTCDWEAFVKIPNYKEYKNIFLSKPEISVRGLGIYSKPKIQANNSQTVLQTNTSKL
ncbi:D-xylose reductase III [Legionella beliardensis]|uniref:D-xylose reductase III n=1 Tax=Legionella beliardensis TaxID=91822 RepID=A0A378JNY2_9GAMM|nr:aldo/keto reductase [Legionella beliardensis]STX55595.1 D-xylose reductase III [Legionella beliardensis]